MKRTIPMAVGTLAIILGGCGTATVQKPVATAVPAPSSVAIPGIYAATQLRRCA